MSRDGPIAPSRNEIQSLRDLSPHQWKSAIAAWLGWLFDGLDMHLYVLVAAPFVAELIGVSDTRKVLRFGALSALPLAQRVEADDVVAAKLDVVEANRFLLAHREHGCFNQSAIRRNRRRSRPENAAIFRSRIEGCIGAATMKIGSGHRVTEKRDLADFTRFEMSGSASVAIELGQRQSVTLELDDNLLPLITTDVHDSTLEIDRREPYVSSGGLRIVIQVLDLSRASLSGTGSIDVINISRASFEAVINGTGTITCEGKADRVKAEIDGSGTIDAFRLSSKSAHAVVNGRGEITAYASDSLVVVISGVGDIRYRGKPSHVEKYIEGVGRIIEE